jgi:hypothetical protein
VLDCNKSNGAIVLYSNKLFKVINSNINNDKINNVKLMKLYNIIIMGCIINNACYM